MAKNVNQNNSKSIRAKTAKLLKRLIIPASKIKTPYDPTALLMNERYGTPLPVKVSKK